jgi:adenylate cyclase class IV
MNDKPVIHITAAEVIEKENETIYDYDNSHVIYKMQDLGSFAELQKMKAVNQQLKEQLQQKEDIINKAKVDLEKHLNAKSYGNHKYELFDRKYLDDLLEILNNKGSDNNE